MKPAESGQKRRKAGCIAEEDEAAEGHVVNKEALDIQFPSSLVKPGKDAANLAGSLTWVDGIVRGKVGVLLMHGAGGAPGASEGGHLPALAEAFARKGFPCVRFDAGRLGVQP